MELLGLLSVFGIPAAVMIGFIVSVIKYKTCPADSVAQKKNWRTAMIVTGITSLVFIVLIFILISLLMLAVANM